jgi:hypothetical protein
MAENPIPAEVQAFILRHIDSVAQLEALLLLRNNPDKRWDVQRVAQRLYSSEREVAEVLAHLSADGLLSFNEDTYRYDSASAEQGMVIDRLAGAYSRHLIAVTNMIHAKPRRIRQFADAFKFKKDR